MPKNRIMKGKTSRTLAKVKATKAKPEPKKKPADD